MIDIPGRKESAARACGLPWWSQAGLNAGKGREE